MASVCLTKQVHRLMKTVSRRTDGQASVLGFESEVDYNCDGADCEVLKVAIEPNAGLYKGGRFRFSIRIPSGFPHCDQTPAVWCESEVFHPNIDTTESKDYTAFATNVCLNMMEIGVYQNNFGLEAIVQGLVFLMHNPNFEDPLAPFFGSDIELDIENVGRYMAGEEIDGQLFALERADTYKEKKDEGTPKQTDDANDKEGSNVANEDDTVENTHNKDNGKPIADGVIEETTVNSENENDVVVNNDDEDDVYTGGYKLVELDGELVMVSADDMDFQGKLTINKTAEDNTDNQTKDIAQNDEPVTDTIELTDITPSTSTVTQEHKEINTVQPKDTNDITATFECDKETTDKVITNTDQVEVTDIVGENNIDAQNEAMPASDKQKAGLVEDAEIENEETAFVQDKIKPPRLELTFISIEKVFRKILTNVQCIGIRFIGCLKRR